MSEVQIEAKYDDDEKKTPSSPSVAAGAAELLQIATAPPPTHGQYEI
jgi:hypothetical protein